jgi:decaprenyl-phosphate phosphoribosyltransferase
MRLTPYIAISRPDHWFKNIFMAPGILLAWYFDGALRASPHIGALVLGIASACLVASSNYVLNEILDAERDRHHPDKYTRPLAGGTARRDVAWALWLLYALAGFGIGCAVSLPFALCAAALWVMGIVYNVRPLRTKDLPYLDVLSEAVNNPIRLAMGWYATGIDGAPPLSLIAAYWMFGAFLMAVKRFAEFRHIGDARRAGDYRASFRHYTEERLLESIAFYACLFAMLSGVFISRYGVRLILATPMVAFCMAYYLHLGFKPNSPVQYPESLFRQKKLVLLVGAAFVLCTALLFLPMPRFSHWFDPSLLPH